MSAWKTQTHSQNCIHIHAEKCNPIKDTVLDPTEVYLLIRIDRTEKVIEVALCSPDHVITHVFSGTAEEDLRHAVLSYEEKNGLQWFSTKQHIAYFGKELMKAEAALKNGDEYVQG